MAAITTESGLVAVSDMVNGKTYYINPARIACVEVWGTVARVWLTTDLMVSCRITDPGIIQLLQPKD